MKSTPVVAATSIVLLFLAVVTSAIFWNEIPMAVKVGMFAFGYGSGVAAGTLLARRQV